MVTELIVILEGTIKSKRIAKKNKKVKKALVLAQSINGKNLARSQLNELNKLRQALANQ